MTTRQRITLGLAVFAGLAVGGWAQGLHPFLAIATAALVALLAAFLLVPREE